MTDGQLSAASELCHTILDEIGKAVIGKRDFLEKMLAAMLAGGHVLIEDNPGLAKTLAAKSLARVLGGAFKRIQFTPDLLPADITGAYVLDRQNNQLRLIEGPVFANFVLADEINRAPPKTQSALLEAMEEKQATLEGNTLPLPQPFMVIATQNPIEYEGTFMLPEAQLDRFLVRLQVGYPELDEECAVVQQRMERGREQVDLATVASMDRLRELILSVEDIHVNPDLCRYAVQLSRATREAAKVAVGASPRASLALIKMARARALLECRHFVIPDDIKWCAFEVFIHRILLKPEAWANSVRTDDLIKDILASVPVPRELAV
ncbi:MAG: MoxR family ATPase [Spirochaetes bacterium]|nr:MoxR family ATPase [Spirochaetota bacterium]MBU0954016.1 MoxR family ATPase [Spirochaetota bacterium]